MRIAIVGHGKMGHAIERLALARGHLIHTIVTGRGNQDGRAITPERLAGADVALEFTGPATARSNLGRLIEAGIPTVTGTTGWAEHLPDLERLVGARGGALLYSPNFSVGVQIFLRAAADLATRLRGRAEFDAFILEHHHAAKLDAPSGTALRLQERARGGDPDRPFPITSVRAGQVPGTHALTYDAAHETIRLEHGARGREAFAAGALTAAEWLPGRRGVYTFEEMLFGGDR